MTKEEELDRLNRSLTHSKRYLMTVDKVGEFLKVAEKQEYITDQDKIRWGELMEEQCDALSIICKDLQEENKELRKQIGFNANALLLYAHEFGNQILVKRFMPDGITFTNTITILPVGKDYISVSVDTHRTDKNDYKHNRRRTIYQKIRDGIVLFRQSIRKP